MGLDILISAANYAELAAGDYDPAQHSLSRAFCDFMDRRDNAYGKEPELDQIGRLVGVEVSALYEMAGYVQPEDLATHLHYATDEEEKQALRHWAATANGLVANNIDRVTAVVEELLARLLLADLPSQLSAIATTTEARYDERYFTKFAQAKWNNYDNTFGQDLRNMKNFLAYARSKGSTTVFFVFG